MLSALNVPHHHSSWKSITIENKALIWVNHLISRLNFLNVEIQGQQ